VAWLFIVGNGGHLLVIAALVQSFHAFPVGPSPSRSCARCSRRLGREIFGMGLWIALPLVAMLLFVNMVLGIVARVAPQINVFAVGFPVTLGVGLLGMLLTLPMMEAPFTMALERMLAWSRPALATIAP
jgi:flagellar biosynthetic protein FliR